jgi:hypothetical protein
MRLSLCASLALALTVLLASCNPSAHTTLDGIMYSWVGQPRNALERAWGPPFRVPLKTGGSLLIYHDTARQNEAVGGDRVSAMQKCRLEVETDVYQKIVAWRYLTERC